jgi:carboxymethylenebutenolidase
VPRYDLEALWDEHCRYEFETRDVDATMGTMIDAPYVNHIPTMTGGVGHDQLKRFYKYHFIGANPPDTKLVPVSRTVVIQCSTAFGQPYDASTVSNRRASMLA